MKSLIIEETIKTPAVRFDAELGIIELNGRSIPEDTVLFYKPLISWIQNYCKTPCDITIVNVRLEYLSSSSSRYILDLFKIIETIQQGDKKVAVNWFYDADDEDMLDLCEIYGTMVCLPFHKIALV